MLRSGRNPARFARLTARRARGRLPQLTIDPEAEPEPEVEFQDVYASLPASASPAISIPGLSRATRDALEGSASPPDYGLSSSPQGISPEEEAALEDVRPPHPSPAARAPRH